MLNFFGRCDILFAHIDNDCHFVYIGRLVFFGRLLEVNSRA
jgi:hypothetical protein